MRHLDPSVRHRAIEAVDQDSRVNLDPGHCGIHIGDVHVKTHTHSNGPGNDFGVDEPNLIGDKKQAAHRLLKEKVLAKQFLIAAATLCCTAMLSAQSINISVSPKIEAQGVTLIHAGSPEAAQYLTHINPATVASIQDLIPYSVVVVNHSSHRMLAEAIAFTFKDPRTGETPHYRYAIPNFNDRPPTQINPGEGRFFSIDQSINVYFARLKSQPELMDPNALAEQFSSPINGAVSKSASHEQLTAVLDCVVLEDVGLIGPYSADFKPRGWDRKTTYNDLREK
ncbi:MAG: hypothetical protein M3Z35_09250 [Nitrospirota bacterium]|nr:hypothetical protein [Nitrospirota bacterium]